MVETSKLSAGGGPPPIVAVFNSSSDTVSLLRAALDAAGFQTAIGHIPEVKQGGLDFVEFVERHVPLLIVYDISPPYDANWNFLRLIRSSEVVRGLPFIITTTNKPALESLVGPTQAIEIIGKPYDLDTVVAAVRSALPKGN